MAKKRRGASTSAAENSTQLEEVAVNVNGWMLRELDPDRPKFEEITARHKSSTSAASKFFGELEANGRGPKYDTVYRTSLQLTEREKGPPNTDRKEERFRIVGYVVPNLPPAYTNVADYHKKQKPVGVEMPADDDVGDPPYVLDWETNNERQPRLLAVAPLAENRPKSTQLFVLMEPEAGLCTPYAIGQNLLFYRAEFRSTVSSVVHCRTAWNKNILDHSVVSTSGTPAKQTRRQIRYRRATDVGKVVVEPEEAFAKSLHFYMEGLRISGAPWIKDAMMKLMEKADHDLLYAPLPSNPGLRSFFHQPKTNDDEMEIDEEDEESNVDTFGIKEAEMMVTEVEAMWGDIEGLTARRILLLHELLTDKMSQIAYADIPMLLDEAMSKFQYYGDDDEDGFDQEDVNAVLQTTHRARRHAPKSTMLVAPDERNDLIAYYTAENQMMKSVLDHFEKYWEQTIDAFGDQAIEGGVWDIWQKFGSTPDTDSAKAIVGEIGRYIATESRHFMFSEIMATLRQVHATNAEVLKKVTAAARKATTQGSAP